jgi:hypothetical protein
MAKMDPQDRVHATLVAMVESRQRAKSRAEADDWMARGWNPMAPQKNGRHHESTGLELMISDGGWTDWIASHKALWPAHAQAAFKPNAQGKFEGHNLISLSAQRCYGGYEWRTPEHVDTLDILLGCRLDPNSKAHSWRENGALPPIFTATRHGAEKLLAAGADFQAKGPNGAGCWEHWATRCMGGSIKIEDLDWMATVCPPTWSGTGARIGRQAIMMRSAPVAERLALAGAGPEAFDMHTPALASSALYKMASDADSSAVLEVIGGVLGWEKTIQAAIGDQVSALDSPLSLAIFKGRVKCLGVLERHGLFGPKGITKEKAVEVGSNFWALSSKEDKKKGNIHYHHYRARPESSGMVWAIGRLGAGSKDAARAALSICVSIFPLEAARLAQTCATKGFLPDSGTGSIRGLYQEGQLWEGLPSSSGKNTLFSEFISLCEDKAFKKAFKPKKSVAPLGRKRL